MPPLADPEAYFVRRESALASAACDSLAVGDWLGWNNDHTFFANPDYDKYRNGRRALDVKIAAGQATPEELVWAANGYALEVDGERRARELYEQARVRAPGLAEVVANDLRWLDARPN